jgi:hypothetical protein
MYGLVKTIDGVKLVGNAMSFILYKNYFGRDLLNDIVAFAKANANSDTVKRLAAFGVKDAGDLSSLTDEQQAELFAATDGYKFDSEFVLNFAAALIATARYPEKVDVTEIIMEIPPHWLADKEVVTELMEFLSLFIKGKKTPTKTGGGYL